MKDFPLISEALLKELEDVFRLRNPDFLDNIETIRYKSGQVSVIEFLRLKYNDQISKILSQQTQKGE